MTPSRAASFLDKPAFQRIRLLASGFRAGYPKFRKMVRQPHRVGTQANDIGSIAQNPDGGLQLLQQFRMGFEARTVGQQIL